jgi:Protein N-terminal asparagine amidohydrolase
VNDACLENILKEHLDYHDRRSDRDCTSLDSSSRTQDSTRVFVSGGRSPAVDDAFGFFADDDDMGASTQEATTSRGFLPSWVEPPSNLQTTARVRPPPQKTAMIEIDLHMVGGFLDTQGASKRLSAALIERFDALARKYSDRVRIYLVTAAISCLNHNQSMSRTRLSRSSSETAGPVHRGLGIDTHTGRVFSVPCSLPPQWAGPAVELRSARRVFGDEPTLAVIHTADSEHIRVEPFCYTPDPKLNVLLHVPDSILLDVTSTSPRHESDNFCSNFRRTLSFINAVPPDTVFGHGARKRPLVYTRSAANLHEWIIADAVPSERMLCRSLAG